MKLETILSLCSFFSITVAAPSDGFHNHMLRHVQPHTNGLNATADKNATSGDKYPSKDKFRSGNPYKHLSPAPGASTPGSTPGSPAPADPLKPGYVYHPDNSNPGATSPGSGSDGSGKCQNGPTSRNCWGDFDINTDYDTIWPNTGAVVEYWLTVENSTLAPDGFSRQVLTFNGTIPGPTLTANWGDTIRVHVTNNLENNGTSVHWHGFRQLNTNDQDGTNGITECPTAPGKTQTYEFVATTYGSSWYHSHFSTQYGDGVVGPIIINGPASANYDEDLGPVSVMDWYHQTVFQTEHFAQHNGPPSADNYLLNGVNAPADNSDGNRFTLTMQKGKKYLLRLINTSTDNFFKVGLDGHTFTVIANDFVPITPFETEWIPMGVGQRYDVIVEAKEDVGNYWLRAISQTSCGVNTNNGLGTSNGIVRYEGAADELPTTTAGNFTDECHDLPSSGLIPIVSKSVDGSTFNAEMTTFAVGGPTVTDESYGANVFSWSLDGITMDIDWEYPTLLKLQDGNTTFSAKENVVRLDEANKWTFWIVQNTFPVPHPMHLHGHDFNLLGQGAGTFDVSNATLNFDNPTRRDTAMLIENGWSAIAFKTDNPGSWLLHCHIGWHVGGGLSLQFLERESEILSTLKIGQDFNDNCAAWTAYENGNPFYQKTDSGL